MRSGRNGLEEKFYENLRNRLWKLSQPKCDECDEVIASQATMSHGELKPSKSLLVGQFD
jgi:hypothetical protein